MQIDSHLIKDTDPVLKKKHIGTLCNKRYRGNFHMYRGLYVIILKDSCGTNMTVGDLYIIIATWQIYT